MTDPGWELARPERMLCCVAEVMTERELLSLHMHLPRRDRGPQHVQPRSWSG